MKGKKKLEMENYKQEGSSEAGGVQGAINQSIHQMSQRNLLICILNFLENCVFIELEVKQTIYGNKVSGVRRSIKEKVAGYR